MEGISTGTNSHIQAEVQVLATNSLEAAVVSQAAVALEVFMAFLPIVIHSRSPVLIHWRILDLFAVNCH